jgi:hypothetical protein
MSHEFQIGEGFLGRPFSETPLKGLKLFRGTHDLLEDPDTEEALTQRPKTKKKRADRRFGPLKFRSGSSSNPGARQRFTPNKIEDMLWKMAEREAQRTARKVIKSGGETKEEMEEERPRTPRRTPRPGIKYDRTRKKRRRRFDYEDV